MEVQLTEVNVVNEILIDHCSKVTIKSLTRKL